MRWRIGRSIDSAAIHALANEHPRLQRFVRTVAEHSERGEARSRAILEHMIRRVLDDVGDMHMGRMMRSLENVEMLRTNIAAILDHVLEGGDLPEGVRVETLGEYFDQLQSEMHNLTRPREDLVGDGSVQLPAEHMEYANSALAAEAQAAGGSPHGTFHQPVAEMTAAFNALTPEGQAAMRRAAQLESTLLWEVIGAEREGLQAQKLAELRTRLGPHMTPEEMGALETSIEAIGRARSRAMQIPPGSLEAALANITNPQLRALVARSTDVWIVQQMAIRSPEFLTTFWNTYIRNGGSPTNHAAFRAYLRAEIGTLRALPAEFTAAFVLGQGRAIDAGGPISVDVFLKIPDNNPRAGGTDMVALTHDDRIVIVDDKSHRLTDANAVAGRPGEARVSSVSAFQDRLSGNMRDDATMIRAESARLAGLDPPIAVDPRVIRAAERLEAAAAEIDTHLASLAEADRASTASLQRINAILNSHQIDLRVTSAMGEVTTLSRALTDLGVQMTSTGPLVPLPGGN